MINKKNIKNTIRNIQSKVDTFNNKYYCDLDLNKFIDAVNKELKRGNQNAWNDVYKSTFFNLYKKTAFNTFLGARNESLSGEEMLESFERDIMSDLANGCIRAGESVQASKNGGMTDIEACEAMKEHLNDIPTSYTGIARNQYTNGKMRIRDMVSFTRSAIENGNIKNNIEAQRRIMGYSIALDRVNDSRSRFWRTIHPFRNNAEQRDAELMRQMLREAIGEEA